MSPRFSDRLIYWALLAIAIIYTLGSFCLILWNLSQLHELIEDFNECAYSREYLCVANAMADYELAYFSYYHIMAGVLCLGSILCASAVVFILQNRKSHFKDRK